MSASTEAMNENTTPATRRRRPLWATVIAVAEVLCGLVFLAVFGIYGLEIRSGRLTIPPSLPGSLATLAVTCLIAWAFWRMWPSAGRLLLASIWISLIGSLALFLWGAKPTPPEILRVAMWIFLPWAILAAVITIFIVRKRDTFEEWAER